MSRASRTLRWTEVDASLRERWSQLVARQKLNPTLEPDWIEIVARALRGPGQEPSLYVEEEGGTLTAVVPFYISRVRMSGVPMTVVQPASNLISYHAELVTSAAQRDVLTRMLASVRGWDVLQFGNVDVDSLTADAVRSLAAELRTPLQTLPGDQSPWLALEESWEKLLASKNKKFRYKVRHRRDLLDKNGPWELRWYEDGSRTDELLDAILKIEAVSWKAAEGVDIPSRPHEVEYHRQLLPFLARQGALLANVIYIGEKPAAYCLCCRHGEWVGNLKTSFDQSLEKLSPGSVVIDTSIERAFALGAKEFDFLGNAGSHKLAWTSNLRTHADYFLFAPRLKARLVGMLKLMRAKKSQPAEPAQTPVAAEAD
jgi:CelD/BcsL family acetyltransferase involved in cellulose biosynthesis